MGIITKRNAVTAICAAILAFTVYANNLGHDWAYDDIEYITQNTFVSEPGHVGDIFSTTYLYGVKGFNTALYRPATILSYAINARLTGLNPGMFHLVNDLIHAANTALVFVFLTFVTGGSTIALPAALLFAVHPIHTEAVNNIVGRAELLAFFFSVLALSAYVIRDRNRKLLYPLSLLFFFAALLSKETPAALPLVILLYTAVQWRKGERGSLKRDFAETGGWFAVLVLYMVLRHTVISQSGTVTDVMMHENPLIGLGFFERLPTALKVTAKYILLLLFPVRLSADYSYNQIPVGDTIFAVWPLIGLVMIAAVGTAGFYSAKRSSVLWFGVLVFALPYVIVSNLLFTTGTIMGERLMYLPSFGFVILLAWVIAHVIPQALKSKRAVIAAYALVIVLYGVRTIVRNPDWKNNATLFTKTAETSPNSVKTAYNYALVLKNEGRLNEAIDWYRRAVAIWPEHFSAWFNLGNTLRETGRLDEAVQAYKRAHELVPEDDGTLQNLALTYRRMNQPEQAVETFKKILEHRPGDPSVLTNIGMTWAEAEDYHRAEETFEKILEADPGNPGALINLGNIAIIRGDTLRAETFYNSSLEANPADPAPHNAILGLLIARGRYEDAIRMATDMKNRRIPVRKLYIDKIEQHNRNKRSTQ